VKNLSSNSSSAEKAGAGGDGGGIRVLVADDYPLLREGVKRVIERESNLVLCGFASDPSATLDAIAKLRPHVVLIAFPLRSASTFALIREARARYDRTSLLVLSLRDDPVLAKRISSCGAQGFIARGDAPECVVEAIHRLVRGLTYVGARASQMMANQLFDPAPARHEGSPIFTEREREILELIGNGLTPREIAEALRLSIKTVESHRENIKQKAGLKTAAKLAPYAFQWLQNRRWH
jgi:DNA-binding NarL/FixJ family response regulator